MLITHAAAPAARPGPPAATEPACRLCGARLHRSLIDLGCQPLANHTIAAGSADGPAYRLHVRICDDCKLVQVSDVASPAAIAFPAPYSSPRSAACVAQAQRYAEAMCKRLKLNASSLVIEIGSSDGYGLRHFQAVDVPVLGIEPVATAAAAAIELGIPTEIGCFAADTAMEIAARQGRADLVVVNNVLPHVQDLFDFAAGLASILRPNGVLTLQVPHLLSLLQRTRFDAFRHDSYTYLSLQVLERILHTVRLRVFDAERIPSDGGSLRVHACHAAYPLPTKSGLKSIRLAEALAEVDQPDLITGFSGRVAAACRDLRDFLQVRRAAGRRIAACGAAAQGSTMLNICGITTEEIACVADPDPMHHGRLLARSRIPIVALDALLEAPPDDILVLPWTHGLEIAAQLQPLRQRGAQIWNAAPRITRL